MTATANITAEQIKHMVDRFLGWRLPETFCPDGGISFEPAYNKGTPYEARHKPTGTNVFTAIQAEAMVRHMIEGLPAAHDVAIEDREVEAAAGGIRPATPVGEAVGARG